MYVRALRITVLKSAGNFTRGECHDLNAEKIQRVKYFVFIRYGIVAHPQFSNTGAAGCVRKFQAVVNAPSTNSRAVTGSRRGSKQRRMIIRRRLRTSIRVMRLI